MSDMGFYGPLAPSTIRATTRAGIHVPHDWGAQWFPALASAKAGTGLARIGFLGSSSTEGYYASNLDTTSFVELIRADLITYTGHHGGTGFRGMQFSDTFLSGLPAGAYNRYKAVGNAWSGSSVAGGWTTPTWWRGPALGYLSANAGATLTIPFTGSSVDIWFFNVYSSAAFTYRIDAGTAQTVTPGAGLGADLAPTAVTASTGGTGAHTIQITAGNGMRFIGISGRNTTGVRVDQYGIAGMQSYGWSLKDSMQSGAYMAGWRNPVDLVVIQGPSNDVIKAVQTYTNVTTTSASTTISSVSLRLADTGRSISGAGIPAAATISSVNDSAGTAVISAAATASGTNVTLTLTDPDPVGRWVTNIQRYLSSVTDNWYGGGTVVAPDLLIFWPLFPTDTANDPLQIYKRLQAVGWAMADTYGAAVVDIGAMYRQSWNRWNAEGKAGNSSDPTTNGSDSVHASDAGHAYYAQQILSVIRP